MRNLCHLNSFRRKRLEFFVCDWPGGGKDSLLNLGVNDPRHFCSPRPSPLPLALLGIVAVFAFPLLPPPWHYRIPPYFPFPFPSVRSSDPSSFLFFSPLRMLFSPFPIIHLAPFFSLSDCQMKWSFPKCAGYLLNFSVPNAFHLSLSTNSFQTLMKSLNSFTMKEIMGD